MSCNNALRWSESGRGLPALQDAPRVIGIQKYPPGFGVRAVLCRFCLGALVFLMLTLSWSTQASEPKKIVFVAGKPSHGPAQHEHRAGCLLLKSCLDKVPGYTSIVYSNGWPKDPSAFDGASTIVLYMDGGAGH